VRLACVRRAANVRSEPGSNSPVIKTVSRSGTKPSLRIDPVTSASTATTQSRRDRFLSRAHSMKSVLNVSLRFSFQGPKPSPCVAPESVASFSVSRSADSSDRFAVVNFVFRSFSWALSVQKREKSNQGCSSLSTGEELTALSLSWARVAAGANR
jgi:hypothetical protein